LLALTSGLAAACFVKAFGITFLAIPRSSHAERAVEVPRSMLASMLLLVGVCAALGLTPFAVVPVIGRVLAPFRGLESAASLHGAGSFIAGLPPGVGQMSPAYVALALLATIGASLVTLRLFTPRFRLRRADAWGCGRLVQTPRMQYTATAFAEPLKRVFAEVYRAREELAVDLHPESKYFIRGISYETRLQAHADRFIYAPIIRAIRGLGQSARRLQAGSVHLYLAYMCAALVILLLAARWLP
jgi:hydrogenase-4 component B